MDISGRYSFCHDATDIKNMYVWNTTSERKYCYSWSKCNGTMYFWTSSPLPWKQQHNSYAIWRNSAVVQAVFLVHHFSLRKMQWWLLESRKWDGGLLWKTGGHKAAFQDCGEWASASLDLTSCQPCRQTPSTGLHMLPPAATVSDYATGHRNCGWLAARRQRRYVQSVFTFTCRELEARGQRRSSFSIRPSRTGLWGSACGQRSPSSETSSRPCSSSCSHLSLCSSHWNTWGEGSGGRGLRLQTSWEKPHTT